MATIQSMTGFGRSEKTNGEKIILVEIKSLNGKQLDYNLKMPPQLKAYEFDIRTMISEQIFRGSIDCNIFIKQNGAAKNLTINTDVAKAYYQTIKGLSEELQLDTTQILSALLKLPEVVSPATEVIDDAGWLLVKETLTDALNQLVIHRKEEGAVLQKDLETRIGNIATEHVKITELAALRGKKIKDGLKKILEDSLGNEGYDKNRLEQELIFYIEKMDISEEQTRLTNHCNYFFDILKEDEVTKGKKLGFILQEIGREINTTGAKAYDSTIQKIVVLMKDELEKAKEQVLNVL